ncbi:GrdB-related putative oxidoreductase [Vagococcus jeotgali]|uniref:GrdB-related putative oxidoreductase n=1 Tax=Vagococcus jeotgali TaxID=3109030 RepID=UPI002DDA6C6C|nr:GrdB-related putative oxidoreductase [Vagococcus sp. B2T-5]
MKVLLIFDQTQAGLGGKEKPMLPLGGKNMGIGAANMLQPFLDKHDGKVVATLYCGDGFFEANEEDVTKKMAGMVKKINPDVVIAGPSYNYEGYASMCAKVGTFIEDKVKIPVVTAMSVECQTTIDTYKNDISIVKMPKKGGTGLTEALSNICELAFLKSIDSKEVTTFVSEHCY